MRTRQFKGKLEIEFRVYIVCFNAMETHFLYLFGSLRNGRDMEIFKNPKLLSQADEVQTLGDFNSIILHING
jgi:hypothetical protein